MMGLAVSVSCTATGSWDLGEAFNSLDSDLPMQHPITALSL